MGKIKISGSICSVHGLEELTSLTKEKSKQNITRDIEIKNIVTIATGEWGGDSGERGL